MNQDGVLAVGVVSTQVHTKGATAVRRPVELSVTVLGEASSGAPVSSVLPGLTVIANFTLLVRSF